MILIYQLLSRRDCQSCSAGWRLTKFPSVFLLPSLLLRNVKVHTGRKWRWHEMIDDTYLCSQFFDVQRKDFWEMFIHHNTTIALIALSWTAHFTRVIRGLSDLKFTFDVCFQQVGTLVILVHDCSDHLLEFAKLLKYTGFQSSCDIFFGLFAVTWVVTRCQQQQHLMQKVWQRLLFQMRCISCLDPILYGSWCGQLLRALPPLLPLPRPPGPPAVAQPHLDLHAGQGDQKCHHPAGRSRQSQRQWIVLHGRAGRELQSGCEEEGLIFDKAAMALLSPLVQILHCKRQCQCRLRWYCSSLNQELCCTITPLPSHIQFRGRYQSKNV